MPVELTVTVLGGGNGAFAMAAALKRTGCRVRMLEAPELAAETIAPLRESRIVEIVGQNGPFSAGPVILDQVTHDPHEALHRADVVLYVVPAYAEERFTALCLPYFRPEQLVVLFSGNFGGALALSNRFVQAAARNRPLIAEAEGLVYTGVKEGPAAVRIGGYKAGLACAALPARQTAEALRRLAPLFPDLKPAANILATGLGNLNPIVHAPVTLLNAGRVAPGRPRWRYYWDGVTGEMGSLIEAVDGERLAVAAALGLSLPAVQDVLRGWYGHKGAQGATLGEIIARNPTYENVWAPQTLDHRFLTEDIPFGLVPIEAMGSALGIETPLSSALITLASRLLAVDFRQEGRQLQTLGLAGLGAAEIVALVEEGRV